MEMRAVMWSSGFSVHADNDSKETTDFRHAFFLALQQNDTILHQSAPSFVWQPNGWRY
jgi:hypothetical protein